LVYAVGTQNQTFGIEGINKYGCFLKELGDAEKIRNKLMDCIEAASLAGQSAEEVDRLLTCELDWRERAKSRNFGASFSDFFL